MDEYGRPYSSFDDSEQFEEDSSWISDSDQVLNWSGWKRSSPVSIDIAEHVTEEEREVQSLIEICSKCVAQNHPFESVELHQPPIPDALQLRIAYYSFPESEEDIRLYSCLASGSNDKFKHGEILAKSGNVRDVLQIGFHLSGVVTQPVSHTPAKQPYNVAITFDRGLITSCQCSCEESAAWCEHASALCLYRIYHKNNVSLRAPVSESLGRLERDQLQKFAQYLISELPQQILPTAQRLLDELLSSKTSMINVVDGAPDPTGGASITEDAKWVLDEASLQENIKKILARFCGTLPFVMLDTNSAFLTSVPPVSLEWSNLLRSFQGHEPEALWNLLSITRHLFARGDRNAAHLLHLITEECLISYQMMFYWILSYNNSPGNSGSRNRSDPHHFPLPSTHEHSRHASAHLMEEIVHLWELTIMTPYLNKDTKLQMKIKFEFWNQQVIEAGRKGQGQGISFNSRMIKDFLGFKAPLVASELDWDVFYQVLGILPKCINQQQSARNPITIRSTKVDYHIRYDHVYPQLVSLMPNTVDEFTLINKLTQSLNCHGYTNQASKLACVLGHKIITTYPERVTAGELNFTEITEKAKDLCEMFSNCSENERITFELAILGLTVPRLPASSNQEEMKLTYLETQLYKRLKRMLITEERLAFIRYQARKLLAKPMLRGDIVLPYIVAIFIFEVLCDENITSCLYSGQHVIFADSCHKCEGDGQLGYQCALVTLGLYSNAVDQKQPMLCESIRQYRRDLALALLLHCRINNERVEEILSVLLDRERYSSFMGSHQATPAKAMAKNIDKSDSKKKGNGSSSPQRSNPKYGFTFADIYADNEGGGGTGAGGGAASRNDRNANRNQHHLSDSDSGNCDDKRSTSNRVLNVPNATIKKTSQQRRHSRQNATKNRTEKIARNDNQTWRKQNKGSRNKKTIPAVKNKPSRGLLTDSDSGQEMNSPYEGDFSWPGQEEDWDAELDDVVLPSATHVSPSHESSELEQQQQQSLIVPEFVSTNIDNQGGATKNIESCSQSKVIKTVWGKSTDLGLSDNTSGGGSSLSSSDGSNNFKDIPASITSTNTDQFININSEEEHQNHVPDTRIPLLLPQFSPATVATRDMDDVGVDEEEEDDFNIAADMFHETSNIVTSSVDPENNIREDNSDPLVSSSSNDSLNVDDFSDQQSHIATVINQAVVVNGIDDDDQIRSQTAQSLAVLSPSQMSDENEEKVIQSDIDEISYKMECLNTELKECGESEAKDRSSEEKNKDLDKIRDVDTSVGVVLDEKLDVKSEILSVVEDQRPQLSNSSSVDSGSDFCSSVLTNVIKSETVKKTTIELADLHAALCIAQRESTSSSPTSPPDLSGVCSPVIPSDSSLNNTCVGVSEDRIQSQEVEVSIETTKPKKNKKKQNKKEKSKSKANKSKTKAKVSMNMQSVEAEAFSLFELAKSLLTQSRNANVNMFSVDVEEVSTTNNMNRRLQLAAFEIGIFALNIHNYSSPNWFSRTYSSYVSWIENLAVDIGTAALRLLNEKWEGVLTPSESIQIACRASRAGDQLLKRTAAELSLSCLPYSQSLNPGEIRQTITLCREQDTDMLERACSAVENASRQGGVQPDLLFRIAREWHYLHEEKRKREGGGAPSDNEELHNRPSRNWNGVPAQNQSFMPIYMTAEQYVQEKMHQQAQEMLGRQLPRYQQQQQQEQQAWVYPQHFNSLLHHVPLPQQAMHSRRIQNIDSFALPVNNYPDELNFAEIPRYLQNSYRVGMRALKALTHRMPDDRPDIRFASAPSCSEDIRWMLALSASLGPPYLKNFCKIVYNAVTSPFLLHDLALEAARHYALFNPAHLASYLKSPSVSPIVQKALAMYSEMVHHNLVLLQPAGYGDFVDLLRRTRSAFCMAPGGMARFNEILDLVRKTYPKKGELWQRIMTGLSTA